MINSTTFNEDCIAGMKRYPDKWFDLAVVDPPYGIGIAKRNGSIGQKRGQGKITKYNSHDWDSAIPNKDYFNQLFRVSKNQIIWGGNYFVRHIPPAMGWIVWDKRQPEGVTFAMAELAFTSINKSVKMFSCSRAFIGNKVANNVRMAQAWAKIHPTQKPIALYDWIFKNYAQPSDKIIDTHLGSQSSRIAADKAGLDFTGFEIDKEYYDMGEKRYKQYKAQLRLW